ncbi:ATP-dependent RNA helicase mtr4 [Haplosporangium sp. Z 767]|nr:ATP-dependent RNA helicase mtr4 [Haplosporangium sp. Z 767]KAF9190013.1 ATP-dependent RNA helicase mtr4 [Haplosporangium sp. Z 11]
MFSGNTDGFDVFNADNVEDYSNYTTDATTTLRRSKKAQQLKGLQPTQDQSGSGSNGSASTHTTPRSSHRSILTSEDADQDMDVHMNHDEDDQGDLIGGSSSASSISSKTDLQNQENEQDEPMPTVTDSFDQDFVNQVASAAGLMPTADGTNVQLTHQVRHQVALPPNWKYTPITQHVPMDPPARTYPFKLDAFQRLATYSIERGESVLVSAHTSAGKTVVAEYAIAMGLKNKQRVIYTSPIKALSNQKYRELLHEFGDVGLMTGDVTMNPHASVLVMTTEILRGMLYRGSEVIREIAWVIFDEIHYMKDLSRGVVWEETIILLPPQCHYVFLSATIPNAMEFAEWICKIKKQPCHVVYTDYRPTPLQHYLFPKGAEGIYLVMNERGQFQEDSFRNALRALEDRSAEKTTEIRGKKWGVGQTKAKFRNDIVVSDEPPEIYKLIKMIISKNNHPVIVFSFGKKECEAYAMQMTKMEINDQAESDMVEQVYNNAISSLAKEDQELSQIQNMLPMLQRGIGIHHAGLLPILKEVIELLFQEGLLKVLFATETFSIGLNMPAKTVMFTSVKKFDGVHMRWLSGAEYIQMSGRAGRRGLDDRGIVIMMLDEKMDPEVARSMVKGSADSLDSAFHISYHMLMNLIRVEGASPEYMLERCFFQFQNSVHLPELKKELTRLNDIRQKMIVEDDAMAASYHKIRKQLDGLARDVRAAVNSPEKALPFMTSGRVLNIRIKDQAFGWGILLRWKKMTNKQKGSGQRVKEKPYFVLEVLLSCAPDTIVTVGPDGAASNVKACPPGEKGEILAVPVLLSDVEYIGVPLLFLQRDIRESPDARQTAYKALLQLQKRFPDGMPILDPVEDMNIRTPSFQKTIRRIEELERLLFEHPLTKRGDEAVRRIYGAYLEREWIDSKIKAQKQEVAAAVSIAQMDELKARKRVLRRLGHLSDSDILEVKGRVVCEIPSVDALLLTEMMFTGTFSDLTVEKIVALLSCFCFKAQLEAPALLSQELSGPLRMMQALARKIAKIEKECKVPDVDEDEYVLTLRFDLMDVVYAWANGATFEEIVEMTDAYEGAIVRTLRSLNELLSQLAAAASSVGNSELETKFKTGIERIKRGVVFASSLYVQ